MNMQGVLPAPVESLGALSGIPNEIITCLYSFLPFESMLDFALSCKTIRDCKPDALINLKRHRKNFARALKSIRAVEVFSDFVRDDGVYTKTYYVKKSVVDYRLHPNGELTITSKSISRKAFGENWERVEGKHGTAMRNGAVYPVSTEITVTKLDCLIDLFYTTIKPASIKRE
jgi:hypothetical protein